MRARCDREIRKAVLSHQQTCTHRQPFKIRTFDMQTTCTRSRRAQLLQPVCPTFWWWVPAQLGVAQLCGRRSCLVPTSSCLSGALWTAWLPQRAAHDRTQWSSQIERCRFLITLACAHRASLMKVQAYSQSSRSLQVHCLPSWWSSMCQRCNSRLKHHGEVIVHC